MLPLQLSRIMLLLRYLYKLMGKGRVERDVCWSSWCGPTRRLRINIVNFFTSFYYDFGRSVISAPISIIQWWKLRKSAGRKFIEKGALQNHSVIEGTVKIDARSNAPRFSES